MRNYQFKLKAPQFLDTERGTINIREITEDFESLGDFISSNSTGIPTYSGAGPAVSVYDFSVLQVLLSTEHIFAGAAVNMYYNNNQLKVRLATSNSKDRYCNGIAKETRGIGSLISIQSNTGYSNTASHLTTPNSPIWLSSIPGLFTNSLEGGAVNQIVQNCGFSLPDNSIYFKYNNPVIVA